MVFISYQMYADVLSEMEYLMLEKGDMDEKLWPEYVGHKAYDTIIFNDLRVSRHLLFCCS